MTVRTNLAAIAISVLMASAVVSQGFAQSGSSSATKGYMDAMSKMQTSMPKDHKGDPDTDFARMMIPHHRGAIDMAKVELQYGKDPELRKMAEKMITDQEKKFPILKNGSRQRASKTTEGRPPVRLALEPGIQALPSISQLCGVKPMPMHADEPCFSINDHSSRGGALLMCEKVSIPDIEIEKMCLYLRRLTI